MYSGGVLLFAYAGCYHQGIGLDILDSSEWHNEENIKTDKFAAITKARGACDNRHNGGMYFKHFVIVD
jgi:hypothetical protein